MVNIISFIVAIIILALLIVCNFPIARVEGRSMYPTYKDGGLLLATRLFNIEKLEIGQVYIYSRYDELGEEIVVVKRLEKIHPTIPNLVYFVGDNLEESYDSRHYGYVNAENIIAKVIWKLK